MWSRGETTTFSRASGREQQRSWRRARQSTAEKSQAMVSRRQLVVVLVMQWMVRSHGGDTAALDLFSGATLATSCRPRRGLSISPSATSTTTPPPARESYLTAAAIVDAALRTGAKEKYECVLKANGNLEKQVLSLEVLLSSKDEAATGDGGASSSRGWWPGRG